MPTSTGRICRIPASKWQVSAPRKEGLNTDTQKRGPSGQPTTPCQGAKCDQTVPTCRRGSNLVWNNFLQDLNPETVLSVALGYKEFAEMKEVRR